MLSACTKEFLSHPIEDKKHFLIEHLQNVGKKAEEIFSQSCFKNKDLAFYSGLLHDIGKINPWYQIVFYTQKNYREKAQNNASIRYIRKHAPFSAWSVNKLLYNVVQDKDLIHKITMLVYGHHTKLQKVINTNMEDDKSKYTRDAISANLEGFSSQVEDTADLSRLNWGECKRRFLRPMKFSTVLKPKNPNLAVDDFLEISYAFSCLLQADRGSFKEWNIPNFDLHINTTSQTRKCPLKQIRTKFQEHVLRNFDVLEPISIINAPTGIGKTKVFLDLISRCSNNSKVERVFYFSPLLALTEDFEKTIENGVIASKEQNNVLIYNHLYSGSLEEESSKRDDSSHYKWVFENETFNKEFVITTTQRLLMTIYSNKSNDKMKMASFRNSLLIIDEVQTIPKSILANLKTIFKKMNRYMGTRFILVSATIPHEICDIKKISLPENIQKDYLKKTKKQISIVPSLDIDAITANRTLVMANTRNKAVHRYDEIIKRHNQKNVIYISSGIRKKDRRKILQKLKNMSEFILVSTQVVEAGVDISFSHVFREEAPLDSIVQVMGRLNREGTDHNARMVIYSTDGNNIPYSPLEFQATKDMLEGNIKNSIQIYDKLEDYYYDISDRNEKNKENTKQLDRRIADMDFEGVWELVKNTVFLEDGRDTMLIPDLENWHNVKNDLLKKISKNKKNFFKKFGEWTALLPVPYSKIGDEKFDRELIEKNILLPKKEYLEEIYDNKVGLDVWYRDQKEGNDN